MKSKGLNMNCELRQNQKCKLSDRVVYIIIVLCVHLMEVTNANCKVKDFNTFYEAKNCHKHSTSIILIDSQMCAWFISKNLCSTVNFDEITVVF